MRRTVLMVLMVVALGCDGREPLPAADAASDAAVQHCDLPAPQSCQTDGVKTIDYPPPMATEAVAESAAETVTEHSAIGGCYSDNVTASERWWWSRPGTPSQGGAADSMQLTLHVNNACWPSVSGLISGRMLWKWLYTPIEWAYVNQPNSHWTGDKMDFYVYVAGANKYYLFDCNFVANTAHNWSCVFYEWNSAQQYWGEDGTMQLYQ